MNLNQLSIIGFVGKNAETKYLPNGTPVTKFSVATKKSWKDENDEWKEKTQWHNVVAFGKSFAQMADRLVKGAHVFVQGELTTREYDRTIKVPTARARASSTRFSSSLSSSEPTRSEYWIAPALLVNKTTPPSHMDEVPS